jgi:hypothetical protein
MWLELSEGMFYFGPGGITSVKTIDLRDKPSTYIFKSELYANSVRIAFVTETAKHIAVRLGEVK